MTYQVKLAVTLQPIWHKDPPKIKIGIDDILSEITLTDTTTINFDVDAIEQCKLTIEFLNKNEHDTIPDQNLDKAVSIESIAFLVFLIQSLYGLAFMNQTIRSRGLLNNVT